MSGLELYIVFLGVPLVIGLAVQAWLRKTFAANSRRPVSTGKAGFEVAREILDRNGLQHVPVERSNAGPLSDHYDPRKRAVHLSEPVFAGRSIAASAVAAHEVGHAIQHATSYVPLAARSAIWPVASFGSQAWFFILLAGVVFSQFSVLIPLALLLFAGVVVFQLVTLPVEFNASRRAASQLQDLGLVGTQEVAAVRQTLNAAALTYVAGALASIAQLAYFLMVFGGRR